MSKLRKLSYFIVMRNAFIIFSLFNNFFTLFFHIRLNSFFLFNYRYNIFFIGSGYFNTEKHSLEVKFTHTSLLCSPYYTTILIKSFALHSFLCPVMALQIALSFRTLNKFCLLNPVPSSIYSGPSGKLCIIFLYTTCLQSDLCVSNNPRPLSSLHAI